MKIKLISKSELGRQELIKLVAKKHRGVKITGYENGAGDFVANFEFNKFLSTAFKGLEKHVLPRQKSFIVDFLAEKGLTENKDYEVNLNV